MSDIKEASGLHKQAASDHEAAAKHHRKAAECHDENKPVSYTHLTLPTNREV